MGLPSGGSFCFPGRESVFEKIKTSSEVLSGLFAIFVCDIAGYGHWTGKRRLCPPH